MGSQGRRVIKLSESAPPANYDALEKELNEEQPSPTKKGPVLNVVGAVKEKGFSADPVPADRISFPRPRITSFPVARHRSDGPHWAPPRKGSPPPAPQLGGESDEGGETSAAGSAEPLQRNRTGQLRTSQWGSARKSALSVNLAAQNVFDDARQAGDAQETSTGPLQRQNKQRPSPNVLKDEGRVTDANRNTRQRGPSPGGASHEDVRRAELGMDAQTPQAMVGVESGRGRGQGDFLENLDEHTSDPEQRRHASHQRRTELEGRDSKRAALGTMDREIDAKNRKALSAMSIEKVAEAQADLMQRLRPDVLEALRKRGAAKEETRLASKAGAGSVIAPPSGDAGAGDVSGSKAELIHSGSRSSANGKAAAKHVSDRTTPKAKIDFKNGFLPDDQTAVEQREDVRDRSKAGFTAGVAAPDEVPTSENANAAVLPPPTTDPWTLRVEAVRSMRFDLEGNVAPSDPALLGEHEVSSSADSGKQDVSRVAERDYLRTEGDPVGNGYSLRDTLALVRSSVPGQRAAALRLIALVLTKAIQSLQSQKFNGSSQFEATGGSIDWQAVWAYALGPEAELVLSLRLALDDGHSTVVAVCARAMQALLSYSCNESYFDSLEGIWPGDKITFTAPIFRRKTKQNEGFIGGGRWKYNVKSCEMFPFSGTATQKNTDDEDGEDTVSDDSHVSNKDVAAGLIRMGVLPRIRYILEVDKLIAAEEALLSVLICFARHSPAAANAVMTCPRLIDTLLQRFVGAKGHLSDESCSSRSKAIRLIRVLCQARRSNCINLEAAGTLQTVIGQLQKGRYVSDFPVRGQRFALGDYENTIEAFCFWRVCVDYGIGVSLFSDCYSTLCFWLLPLSEEEMISGGKERSLSLATESYHLLEHLARTLPPVHANLEARADPGNWTWSICQAMVDTAVKWVSPQQMSGIRSLLRRCVSQAEEPSQQQVVLDANTRRALGAMTAVLHFLATVCEKVISKREPCYALDEPDNGSVPWLPTFLPNVGLAIARSLLLHYSEMPPSTSEAKHTLLECLRFCQRRGDHDSALAAINFLSASVRVSSIVDRVIQESKPKTVLIVADQTVEHQLLDCGLVPSAEIELRKVLVLCEVALYERRHLLQMTTRGGPAPGVGIGWGALCGGAWSKEILIARASARLAHDLMSIFSSKGFPRHSQNAVEAVMEGQPSEAIPTSISKRMNFGLTVIAISTALDRELLFKVFSDTMFQTPTLAILTEKVQDAVTRWRVKRDQEPAFHEVGRSQDHFSMNIENIAQLLKRHFKEFWLAVKARQTKEEGEREELSKKSQLGLRLETVYEGQSEDFLAHPESLMGEWVRQRLPLPSYWFLSPMVTESTGARSESWKSGVDHKPEEIINAGLSFFLGFETLTAGANLIDVDVPLVRKIHGLSTVFVSGGDPFLDPHTQYLIGALQDIIGDQLGGNSTNSGQPSTENRPGCKNIQHGPPGSLVDQLNHARSVSLGEVRLADGTESKSTEVSWLDFEGSIDANYVSYAEVLAEQFVASSFGELTFGRQVALHLCSRVPDVIRLATWRVLKDGSVLDLLPPLSHCCGPRGIYLYPIEANQQILDAFVGAWSSGALSKAARRNSLPFTLALHHLAGYLFDKTSTEDRMAFKKKTTRLLVRSAAGNVEREDMIARLICYVPVPANVNEGVTSKQAAEAPTALVESRVLQFLDACSGDNYLTMELRRLQTRVTSGA